MIQKGLIYKSSSSSSVHDPTLLPDLALASGEHVDGGHLHHGRGELGSPSWSILGVAAHRARRQWARLQGLIREQYSPVLQKVLVVLVVQPLRRHFIEMHRGRVGTVDVDGGRRALALQVGRQGWVHRRILRLGGAEAVQPPGEGGTMGAADRVSSREGDHVVERQPFLGEVAQQIRDGEIGQGDVAEHLRLQGNSSVAPSGGHRVVDAAGQ